MKFDIVPINSAYRGIGRSLTPEDFQSKCARGNMDKLIQIYYDYITECLKSESQETFEHMLEYCGVLNKNDIPCELIVYDSQPLESAYGKSLSFLGIDIVHEMTESLLENAAYRLPKTLLNEHLLCNKVMDVTQIITLCDHGGALWLPCWVYHVV